MPLDTFDEVLGLEEQYYTDGYAQGLADGGRAGQIEGRTFGLEKGFEKYLESGRLHGKSLIWASRLSHLQEKSLNSEGERHVKLPSFSENVRLAKHVKILHALAESDTLSTENTEESVSDFDDRLKRAQAKAKMIDRMAGEGRASDEAKRSSKDRSIEDISVVNARH
jgi:hypothetical protein